MKKLGNLNKYHLLEIDLEKTRYHLPLYPIEIVLEKLRYDLPEITLEKLRYDLHGDCSPLLNHLLRDGTSILQVQSPWQLSIIKYMTISIRDCTLKNRDDLWEIVPEFLKYHLWEILILFISLADTPMAQHARRLYQEDVICTLKMVTISGDRFRTSLPFFRSVSFLCIYIL